MQRVKLKDGRRRRLLHKEAARLQSFPDWFEFCGNETEKFNQIGNAVPPLLAYKVALAVKESYYNMCTESTNHYYSEQLTLLEAM